MQRLTLANGHTLEFAITIGTARRVKSLCGINLLQPSSEHAGQPLVAALYGDIELFVDVLYVLCVPDPQTLSPEDFATGLPAAWQESRDALFQEWIDFFLQAGLADKAATVQKSLESLTAALRETWQRLQTIDTGEQARQEVRKIDFDQLIQRELNRMTPQPPPEDLSPGTKSNDLPASSASILTR